MSNKPHQYADPEKNPPSSPNPNDPPYNPTYPAGNPNAPGNPNPNYPNPNPNPVPVTPANPPVPLVGAAKAGTVTVSTPNSWTGCIAGHI
jgi:hypothetical protein